MADFSATDVAFSGIRFVRERPRAVAVWAGLQLVLSVAVQVVVAATIGPTLASMTRLGSTPNPQQSLAVFQNILPFEGVAILVSLVFYSIVYATVNRAVLRPSDSGFGYIRLGMDEVRQFLLLLIWMVLGFIFEIILVIVAAIIVGVTFGLQRAGAAQAIGGLVVVIVLLFGTFFAWAPFSLCSAQTFDRKQVMPFASLRLAGPRYWKMCGTYALTLIVAFFVWLLGTIITFALMAAVGGGATIASMFTRAPAVSVGAIFALPSLVALVISAMLSTLLFTLLFMPAPEIYRHLSGAADPALDPSTFD